MEAFIQIIQSLQVILLIIVLVGIVFLFTMISQTNRKMNRLKRRYDIMLRGTENINLEEYLTIIGTTLNIHEEKIVQLEQAQEKQKENLANALTKTGFIRYSAFSTEDAPRSWSLALLDRNDTGVIITTIFGREGSTTFAKEVTDGKPEQTLSEQEQQALTFALESEHALSVRAHS